MSQVKITTPEDAIDYIRDRMRSQEWWMILAASEQGHQMAMAIEERFYMEHNEDFELVLLPGRLGSPLGAIVLARKIRALPREVGDLLGLPLDGRHDVILTPDAPAQAIQFLASLTGCN